jgi:hypothetical protein
MIARERMELVLQSQKALLKITNSVMNNRKALSNRHVAEFIVRCWQSLKMGLCSRLFNNKGQFNPEGVSQTIELGTDNLSGEESCPKNTSNTSDVLGRMTNVPPR